MADSIKGYTRKRTRQTPKASSVSTSAALNTSISSTQSDSQQLWQSPTKKPKVLAKTGRSLRADSNSNAVHYNPATADILKSSPSKGVHLSPKRAAKPTAAAVSPQQAQAALSTASSTYTPPPTTSSVFRTRQTSSSPSNKMEVCPSTAHVKVPAAVQFSLLSTSFASPIVPSLPKTSFAPIRSASNATNSGRWAPTPKVSSTPSKTPTYDRRSNSDPPKAPFGQLSSNKSKEKPYYVSPSIETPRMPRNCSLTIEETSGDLPSWGLPTIVTEILQNRGLKKLHDWQVECLTTTGVLDGTSLVYSLPTSGGKTFVAEITMLRSVFVHRKVAVFVLPYVAIVTEKVKSLKEFGKRLGFDVEGYFQNNGKIPMPKDKPMIAICTIEKANVLINSLIEEGRLNEIGLVVFDEMHMLGDPNRGYLLEILGTKIKFAGKNGIQMVGMSATMPNLGDLAKWIGGVAFSRDFRPVQLVEHVFNGPHLLSTKIYHPSPGEQDQQAQYLPKRLGMVNLDPLHFKTYAQGLGVPVASVHGAFQLVRQLLPHNCALVFCHSKAITTKLAIEFAARLSETPISKDSMTLNIEWFNESAGSTLLQPTRRSMSAKEFADHMQKLNDERLMLIKKIRAMSTSKSISSDLEKCLLQGVAWHNADLGAAERELIEAAFRTRTIGVICCTSTLAAGVNLPARRVILMSNKMGPENLSIREYRQMVGRAGRAGIDDFGESFLFITPGRSAVTEHAAIHLLAQSMEPVYSCLKDDKSANDFSVMRSARHALDRRSKSDPRIQTHPTPFRLIPGATNLYFPEEPIYSLFCVKLNGINMNTTGCGVDRLVLDAIGGRSAVTPWEIFEFVGCSFLAATLDTSQLEHIIMKSIQFLHCLGFVEKVSPREANQRQSEDPDYESGDPAAHHRSKPRSMQRDYANASFHPNAHPSQSSSHPLDDQSGQVLVLSILGAATYRTSFSIETAIYTHEEISKSLKGLDLTSDLQLCWLVAPVFSRLGQWGSHFETWLELLNHLTSNQRSLAERVGVEASIFCSDQQGMVKPSSSPAWQPTQRFFMALILQDVVDEMSMVDVANKYAISAGDIEGLMTQASQHAGQLVGFCKRLGHWHLEAIFKIFALRVGLGVKQEIIPLMKIRGVKGARARLLYKKGYQSVRTIANAEPHEIAKVLSGNEDVSSTKLAKAIIRNAKAFLDQAATELRTTAHSFSGPSPQESLPETRGIFTTGHQQKASKPSHTSHLQHYEESQAPHNEALLKQTEVEREMDLIKGMWDYDPYMSDDDDLAQAEIEFALMDQM